MITLPCGKCGTEMPLPVEEVAALQCPQCGTVRELKWFRSPRVWERWWKWKLFDQPRLAAAKTARR